MYAVFYKGKFKACLKNKKGEKVIKNAIDKLGWAFSDIKLFEYDDEKKYFEFLNYRDNHTGGASIFVDFTTGKLEKVDITQVGMNITDEDLTPDNEFITALDHYTQLEIDNWVINQATRWQWRLDNSVNSDGIDLIDSPTPAEPALTEAVTTLIKGDWVIPFEYTSLDFINGTEVDVFAKYIKGD